jgi:transposase
LKEVSIIGVDLAKNSFQLDGASANGAVVFCKKLRAPRTIECSGGNLRVTR